MLRIRVQFLSGSSCILFWLFMFLRVNADIECKAGQKISITRDKCEPCDKNQYRESSGMFAECLNCFRCDRHSEESSPCTPVSNTRCRCRKGFERIKGRCMCKVGSGIEKTAQGDICKKCEYGTFSNTTDSTCQPWRKCDQNGEKNPGSDRSDVVCKNAELVIVVTSSVISLNFVPQTSTNSSAVAWSTPSNSLADTTSAHPERKKHGLWLGPLGAILALLFIQFVIIQMKPTKWFKNKQQIVQQGSTCRKPVEESGEKCLLPSV